MRATAISSFVIVLLCQSLAAATTIVVARSKFEIVMGADSKVTDSYGNNLNNPVCKILPAGNLFIAFEGLRQNRGTGFDVMDFSLKSLQRKRGASAAERVSLLSILLRSRLVTELLFLKRHDQETYLRKIQGQVFLRIVVAGFEHAQPLVFVRQFRANQRNDQISIEAIANDCLADCKAEVATRFLGETEAIEGLAEETPDYWQGGLANGVRKLIQTEIDARDEYVGPPIDLLRITARGAEWLQKKRECTAIRDLLDRRSRSRGVQRKPISPRHSHLSRGLA